MPGSKARRWVAKAALLVGLCLLRISPSFQAPGMSEGLQLRGFNGDLLKLVSQLRRAPEQEVAQLHEEIRTLANRRLAALQSLMQQNPEEALSLAFPENLLRELKPLIPETAAQLESHGFWQGRAEVLIADDDTMTKHQSHMRLHTGTETLALHAAEGKLGGLKSGDLVSVRGVRAGGGVAAADGKILASTSASASACTPIGAQRVVAVLVNFPNYTLSSAVTPELVRGILLGNANSSSQSSTDWSVDDFWQQNSDGQTWVDVANSIVVGPYALSRDYNSDTNGDGKYDCEDAAIRSAAIAAADADVNFQNYSRVLIVMPKNTRTNPDGSTGGCTWAGLGSLGCWSNSSADGSFTASIAWQRSDQMANRSNGVKLTTHEFGHNLTLHHARSRDFGSDAIGPLGTTGTLSEYGDLFSTMGSWNFGFYSAHHAAQQLNWLAPTTNYLQVESNGTFTLQNYEGRPAGLKALKIRRGTGNNAWLWVEARKNTGIYDSQLNSQVFSGALIHYQDSSTGSSTDLADFTTSTSSMSDPALAVGQSWTDPYSNVSVNVDSATSESLTVTVNYGALPCTLASPGVSLSPTSASVNYGSSRSFTVTLQNNDSAGCSANTFNLSGTMPDPAWSFSFASPSLTVSPGQQGQTTMTVTVPNGYALGTYPFSATGTNAGSSAYKGTGSANLTVTEPVFRLTVSVSSRGTVNMNPPNTNCRGTCAQDYPTSASSQVTLTATPDKGYVFKNWSGACSGTQTTCTVTMTADRSVTATFAKSRGR